MLGGLAQCPQVKYNGPVCTEVKHKAWRSLMVKYDPECLYNESHEWIRIEGNEGVIGISDYAQSELNDVVYVELPEEGDAFEKGEEFGTVESVKAASELYMPVSGEVIAVNRGLEDSPELVNQDPFGAGWMVRVMLMAPKEVDELLDVEAYKALCEEE
jgi:glycine cleavage system H protein